MVYKLQSPYNDLPSPSHKTEVNKKNVLTCRLIGNNSTHYSDMSITSTYELPLVDFPPVFRRVFQGSSKLKSCSDYLEEFGHGG
jgi:hypothetical protein